MKHVITGILLFVVMRAYGQFHYCDTLILRSHYTPFYPEGIKTVRDYINKYYPDQARFFSARPDLKPLPLWYNADSIMFFNSGSEKVEIIFTQTRVSPDDIFDPKNNDEAYSYIREYSVGTPFGITSEDSVVTSIASIHVNGKKVLSSAFNDLMSPNRYETYLSIKPIEVFESPCKHYFYIYIFGKLYSDPMLIDPFKFSYMAKIIVTKKGLYVDRIVVSGDTLSYFGFNECPDFIGF